MALLAECPVCRRSLRWTYMLRPMWSRWRCDGCGSLLGINRKRRLLAILPFVAMVFSISMFVSRMGFGDLAAIPVILVMWMPYFLLVDRAVVVERCGFRCKQCGYDLQGQVVPRCPECGREFDAEERVRLEAGFIVGAPVVARPWRRLAFALLIILPVLVTVGLGIACYRTKVARQRAVAARPAAQAASQASVSEPSADED